MITGLSAFPLTPLCDDRIDEPAFAALIRRLDSAGVDSITALGSTGSYAYLSENERTRVAHLAVENAGSTPVFIGIGALRTSQVLAHAAAAQSAGAAGLLLAPMSYQPLTEADVFGLFRTLSEHSDLPVIVYDNPGTTHFTFSLDLYQRLAELPGIASFKIPGVPASADEARMHLDKIRKVLPENISIGVSGDASAARGLAAGCDAWYSVIGGTLPELALRITRAAQSGDHGQALAESARLAPLWELFAEFGGSIRVVAAIAERLGLAQRSCLPQPLLGLTNAERARLAQILAHLGL